MITANDIGNPHTYIDLRAKDRKWADERAEAYDHVEAILLGLEGSAVARTVGPSAYRAQITAQAHRSACSCSSG